ncbi:MAG TPA: extensin family protein [Acetobacteraceae bacterium]|nr:extensin family protein [Acetobacteraceae bacterium]
MAWRLSAFLRHSSRPQGGAGLARVLAFLIAVTFAGMGFLYQNSIHLPPNTLPWEPIDLNAPPNWIAHYQLNALTRDGAVCRTALARTSLGFVPLKDRRVDDACGFRNVVRADKAPIEFVPHTTATCGLTAALYWYQSALQKAALEHLHSRLVRIDQLGTFACRNVNSEAVGPRSEHATANAIDVAAFHFADGVTITVARDYDKPTPAGRFLNDAHASACELFNTVLGPHYNQLHATHFHLDMGSYRVCS